MLPWEPVDPELSKRISDKATVRYVPYPTNAPRLIRVLAQEATWLPRAWSACRHIVAEHRPEIVLTSGPPHCVHALGYYLKRKTRLPWVADLRDPWITGISADKLTWRKRWTRGWECSLFANADLVLANAPNAKRMYESKYPHATNRIIVLTNGFDPPARQEFPPVVAARNTPDTRVNLLHAGEIYGGRDPSPLLQALGQVNAEMPLNQFCLQILGRSDIALDNLLVQQNCTEFVSIQGQRTYDESLMEMTRADILVLLDNPGRTIGAPAKLYEYFRAGRPILALSEPDGDVATILRESSVLHRIVSPTDASHIRDGLRELVQAMRVTSVVANPEKLRPFTRECITRTLVDRLNSITGELDPQNRTGT